VNQEDSEAKQKEVLGFLEKVAKELGKREEKLFEIDSEMKKLESELSALLDGRLIRGGNSSSISVASGYKEALRRKLKEKELEKIAALSEVEKAKERQKIAKLELAQIQAKSS